MSIASKVSLAVFPDIAKAVTTSDIISYLKRKYPYDSFKQEYVSFAELRMGAGYHGNSQQGIDFWAMGCYSGTTTWSYEIKVSRSDFFKEVKNPLKRKAAMSVSNYYFFITPRGLVKPEEVPADCGLVECWWTNNRYEIERITKLNEDIRANAHLKNYHERPRHLQGHWREEPVPEFAEFVKAQAVIPAPYREPYPPNWNFVASLARRMWSESHPTRENLEIEVIEADCN